MLDQGLEFSIDEEEPGAGVLEDVVDFVRTQPRIYSHQDAPGSRYSEMCLK